MIHFRRAAPIVAALALGCGALQTPDLQHGAVTGQITGAQQGAYAYVLGQPDVFAFTAADGTFRLDNVPVGAPRIVLFDGNLGAESLQVEVEGATESYLNPGRPLNAACTIVAAASPLTGTLPAGLTFTVEGTPLRQVNGELGARLFPLPAGTFTVRATQPGFLDKTVEMYVDASKDWPLEVQLDVDEGSAQRGCVSCGCDHLLVCNPVDGHCYQCVADPDCVGGTCTSTYVCSYPPGTGQMCEACTVPSDCQGSSVACVNPTGGTLTGYCSVICSSSDGCPSGYDCQNSACVVLSSCLALTATYGTTCTEDDNCKIALKDGKCFPFTRPSGTAGYCSAKVQAGCPTPGFGPDPVTGYCAKL